ncbi:MAG: hypothetical protein IKK24_02530 [Clostridia bacterium]|nr:hypothetical protein [Clostridia bacterium]
MRFRFNIEITDKEYYDFNNFVAFRSKYGKKMLMLIHIICIIMLLLLVVVPLIEGKFQKDALIGVIPGIILVFIWFLLFKPFMKLITKLHLKLIGKNAKKLYSPSSVIEFFDDCFCETTHENKNEHKYFAIESVSVVEYKAVYIHINSMLGYIIPAYAFTSPSEYEEFLKFIKEKVTTVNYYK